MSSCTRCGACCRDGGPALHHQDLGLLAADPGGVRPFLDISDLVTLRAGEPVRDQPAGEAAAQGTLLDDELVKIRGQGEADWTCVFYDPRHSACVRHPWRPWECRLQDCRNPEPLRAGYAQGRVTRQDILTPGGRLAALASMHEAQCGVADMAHLALSMRRGDDEAHARLLHMLAVDHSARAMLAEAGGGAAEWFVLGRPMGLLLGLFGLGVTASRETGAPTILKTGLWRYPMPEQEHAE